MRATGPVTYPCANVTDETPPPPLPTSVPPLLAGKRILVTGVLTPKSIAFSLAEAITAAGGELVLTSFGRAMSLTEKSAKRLTGMPDVLEMDITNPEQVDAVADEVRRRWGTLDGVVHSIGYAPDDALGGNFMNTPWESVAVAFHVSSYSYKALGAAFAPLMPVGSAMVCFTFDATRAWPLYDWMGPAKAALESVNRYMARDLGPKGIRVNTIAAGPLDTVAAKAIPGFHRIKEWWDVQAPIGWDPGDSKPVADTTVFMLSDWSRAITGEIVYVDGGYHSQGAPPAIPSEV